jgi:hypothetical protein
VIRALVLALVLSSAACAAKAPPSLSPVGVRSWQANEAVLAFGVVQSAAIGLNGVTICDPTCRPALSDANTRRVIQIVRDTVQTIDVTPAGWQALASTGLMKLEHELDAAGHTKLTPYLVAARAAIGALP